MAPRPLKKEGTPSSTDMPEVLNPRTEKAKVDKVKKAPKEKAEKAEKAPKAVRPKVEKAAPKKVEKDTKDGKVDAKKGAGGEKEKVKVVTGDEAVTLIVEYLKSQNRPYSATEISANLHGKVTKTVADKLLKELGETGILSFKATNKEKEGEYARGTQFVFWTPQEKSDAASPEELASIDAIIASLKSSNPLLVKELKHKNAQLAILKSMPTTSEIQTMVDTLRVQNAGKAEKLAWFKSGNIKMFSKEEMASVEKAHRYWSRAKTGRKRAYEELESLIMEGGKSMEDIREELGVEGDE